MGTKGVMPSLEVFLMGIDMDGVNFWPVRQNSIQRDKARLSRDSTF